MARKLAGWLGPLAGPGGWRVPGTGALARARRRAGPAPLQLLFTRLAGPLASPATPGAFAFGRLLAALDGTMLDVPYTPANLAAFGRRTLGGGAGAVPAGPAGHPDRLRHPRDHRRGVPRPARGPVQRAGPGPHDRRPRAAGPGMLVVADRNFCGYPVAAALAATGADLLIRAKSSQRFPVLEVLADGSWPLGAAPPGRGPGARHRNGERRRRGSPLAPTPAPCCPGSPSGSSRPTSPSPRPAPRPAPNGTG